MVQGLVWVLIQYYVFATSIIIIIGIMATTPFIINQGGTELTNMIETPLKNTFRKIEGTAKHRNYKVKNNWYLIF